MTYGVKPWMAGCSKHNDEHNHGRQNGTDNNYSFTKKK